MTEIERLPLRFSVTVDDDDDGNRQRVGLGMILPPPFEAVVVGWMDPESTVAVSVATFPNLTTLLSVADEAVIEFLDDVPGLDDVDADAGELNGA